MSIQSRIIEGARRMEMRGGKCQRVYLGRNEFDQLVTSCCADSLNAENLTTQHSWDIKADSFIWMDIKIIPVATNSYFEAECSEYPASNSQLESLREEINALSADKERLSHELEQTSELLTDTERALALMTESVNDLQKQVVANGVYNPLFSKDIPFD